MSGRRRTRENVGMNLFPFLAVLICTMGGLIMLLVVMVQQARVRVNEPVAALAAPAPTLDVEAINRQRQAAYQQSKAIADQQQQEIDEFKWQTSLLSESYQQTVEDLADQRLALSHVEAHARELSERASRMQSEADLIAQTALQDAQVHDQTRHDLAQLESQLASAKQEIDKLRKDLANRKPKYSLVPYDGPHGTQRPPIYLECFADRVVMQPENVILIGEDFRAPLTTNNPLALALRAKREFMLEQGLLQDTEPYPLLVIRPGAATSYAAARSAMKAWESEFGYELVEDDIELDYQVADPRLTQLLNDIVIEARGKRRLMRAARSQPSRQRELLRPAIGGGFETVRNGSSSYAGGPSYDGDGQGVGGYGDGDPFDSKADDSRDGSSDGFSDGSGDGFGDGSGGGFGDGSNNTPGSARTSDRFGNKSGTGKSRLPSAEVRFAEGSTNSADHASSPSMAADPVAGPGGDSEFGREGVTVSGGGGGTSTTAEGSGGKGTSGNGGSSTQNQQSASSSMSMAFDASQSLAQTRGKNWALPNTQVDAVGIKRPINVVCDRESIILAPERGTRQEVQIFRHGGAIPGVIDPFVDAIHARLQSWGIAGHGIYWRPVLQVKVSDDATGNYRQLLQLLDNSGIEVTREP